MTIFDLGRWPEPELNIDCDAPNLRHVTYSNMVAGPVPKIADITAMIDRMMAHVNNPIPYPVKIAASRRAFELIRQEIKLPVVEANGEQLGPDEWRIISLPVHQDQNLTGAKYVVLYSDESIKIGDLEPEEIAIR